MTTEQFALFIPTSHGEQPAPIQARLLHRREDPATSVAAAKATALVLTREQEYVYRIVALFGPGTGMELALASLADDALGNDRHELDGPDRRYRRIMQRTRELIRMGKIERTSEVRNGKGVLRVVAR